MEGNAMVYFKLHSLNLLRRTGENHGKTLNIRDQIPTRTSQIRSRNANHSSTISG
jgi:hypothetical protein